ncbi:MAG: hypothetical protein FWD05_14580, partial [Oscillospiraceae bacterium]|nr:hypothetical protein [Oscillospiraceae bacterium]
AFIDEKLSRTTGMQHHVEGSTFSTASFQSLLPALQTAHQERDAIRDEVAIAAMYEQARFDALVELWSQERTERGVLQWVVGGLVVIGGVAAIVLTAGMATPFVVAGVVAGTAAIAYGASEMREGQHNVALGMAGDPFTSAFNPLRDTIFMGNQQAYDIFGMVAVASTAVVSLGAGAVNVGVAATNAGTSVLRAVCVYAGKVAISGGAGYLGAFGSRELALHFGASETMADLAGVFGGLAAGTAAGLGTHAMDRRLNVSGFHRRPIDPSFSNINGEVNSIDLPEGTWDQGPTARGQTIDQAAGNNTGRTFPVVDRIDERGVVTSIKSRDLRAPTYQRASRLESTIRTDINKVAGFQGADRTASGGIEIRSADITGRQLQVVVPNAPISNSQVQAINNAITHGQSRGVNVIITIGR